MPEFLIEDTQTGVKLAVEGDTTPTQEDAHALIGDELSTLRTNLYEFPGGRYFLDVGPNATTRKLFDKPQFDEVMQFAKPRVMKEWEEGRLKGDDGTNDIEKYKSELDRIYKEEKDRLSAIPEEERDTTISKVLSKLPENTFLLSTHGGKSGGLSTDWGHEFTLNNIAQLLGPRSNSVQNFFNSACWGGKCDPDEYSSAFPNVTNIVSTAHTNSNWTSVSAFERGNFWRGDIGTSRWIKRDEKWMLSNDPQPDDIDWGGEPIAPEKPQEGKE